MELILSPMPYMSSENIKKAEKILQAFNHNASVGNVYPADERFAEVKRNVEIRETLKSLGEVLAEKLKPAISLIQVDPEKLRKFPEGGIITGLDLRTQLTYVLGDKEYSVPCNSDRSESLGIAADIIENSKRVGAVVASVGLTAEEASKRVFTMSAHGPGVNCEPGVACVPFKFERHEACRYCNQVVG